jgi:2-oxoglutarate dehydrogenase E1 component
MCAEDNIQVCNPTTPAQYFHLLRRQIIRPWRKPLVVMTPKSLLRHKVAVSTLQDLVSGSFQRLLTDPVVPLAEARRILLCSGKVYFDLLAARDAAKVRDVAIFRLEQLYPLPEAQLGKALAAARPGTPLVWVQEEPQNMGGWTFLTTHWPESLAPFRPQRVSRPESASPATGSHAAHKLEQELLVKEALGTRDNDPIAPQKQPAAAQPQAGS